MHLLAQGYAPIVLPMEVDANPAELRLTSALPDPPVVPASRRGPLSGQVRRQLRDLLVFFEPLASAADFGLAVPRWTRVNPAGYFEVQDLAHGEYRVRLLPLWAAGGSWPDLLTPLDGSDPVTVQHGLRGLATEDLVLTPRCGRLQGHVGRPVSRGDGRGERPNVAGALIYVSPAEEGTGARRFWPPVETGKGGDFVFGQLPPGLYRVVLQAGASRKETLIEVAERGLATWNPMAEY